MAPKSNHEFNVVIIGSGIGGLLAAIALKTKWGLEDFVIYERASDIGGTWRDNVYPGCASDVPIHNYSLASDPKPDWKRSHALQPEILEYLQGVTDKYGLRSYCKFHTSVDNLEWDPEANVWRIETRDVRTGETQQSRATAVVSAIGILVVPRFPTVQGIDSFKGDTFHSARWRKDIDLHGKRVGVLGNGSSACQFIPIISNDPTTSVVNFARTPMWYVPSPFIPYRETTKWIFARFPLVQRLYRYKIAARDDSAYIIFGGKNSFLGKLWSYSCEKYAKKVAPAKYHDVIIPNYPLGCRRVVRDQGYLEALHRENVRLTFDHIDHVEPDGAVLVTGEKVPLDVIIYGTGFVTDNYPLDVRGPNGTLKEYNDAHGGPMAYLGSTVPGFPNFFMMQGPNTTTGHTSVIYSEESQIPHLLQLLDPLRSGALTSVAPTVAATEKYNDMLQARLENSVWTQCASWYRVGSRGRIFSTFPGPLVLLRWWLRKVRWEDYEVAGPGAEAWRRSHARRPRGAIALAVTLLGAMGALVSAVFFKGADTAEILKQAETIVNTVWDRALEQLPSWATWA
ncbi:FAD/NAD-binding domain-containing protein [Gloeopeniophorella convolvens]|nr:FAD/NAD-binding domain-containing protein [Gloeopeniophorella convolvens]